MARSGAKQKAIRGLLGGGGPPVSDFTETGPDSYHASFAEALTKNQKYTLSAREWTEYEKIAEILWKHKLKDFKLNLCLEPATK